MKSLSAQFHQTIIEYRTKEPAGTIIIDTPNTYLYLVIGKGKAMRTASASAAKASLDREGKNDEDGGVAGLASTGRDDRAAGLSAALHGGR